MKGEKKEREQMEGGRERENGGRRKEGRTEGRKGIWNFYIT
jgi:hypothetical protein